MNDTLILSIVGISGSGKTTLIEKVIKHLVKKGYRIGVIKHDAHGFDIDYKGKDSYRHKKAGAEIIVLSSPKKVAVIKDVKRELSIDELKYNFLHDNLDIIITEGYKKAKNPKIEVVRRKISKEPFCKNDKYLIAYATNTRLKTQDPRLKTFDINNARAISDFIEDRFLKKKEGNKGIQLMVNGRDVSLKPFIAQLLKESVSGIIRSLKGCKNAEDIDLRIKR